MQENKNGCFFLKTVYMLFSVIFVSACILTVKTVSSVRKHFQKVVCFILFIYSQAFNNNVIFNRKSYCCNDTFTYVRFTSLLAKNI